MDSSLLGPLILLPDLLLLFGREAACQIPSCKYRATHSLVMLNSFRISSGLLPLIKDATHLHPTSLVVKEVVDE